METSSDKQALLSRLAADMNELSDLYFLDTISNPELSVAASISDLTKSIKLVVEDEEGPYITPNLVESPLDVLDVAAYNLSDYMDEDGERLQFDFTNVPAAVDQLRERYNQERENPIAQANILMNMAFIAAALKPAGPIPDSAFKRPRTEETPEQYAFRSVLLTLRSIATSHANFAKSHRQYMQRQQQYSAKGELNTWMYSNDPLAKEDRATHNQGMLQLQLAPRLLALLQSENHSGQKFRGELVLYVEKFLAQEDTAAETETTELTEPIAPNIETGWDILPGVPRNVARIVLAESGIRNPRDTSPIPSEIELPERDQRILHLSRVALAHYNGDISKVKIAVRRLGKTRRDEFIVAILDRVLADGTVVEDAAGEAVGGRKAMRVFRAEKGLNDDGTTWLTWEDVFAGNVKDAELLGAKKIIHSKHFSKNFNGYMALPAEDLED